MYIPEFNRVEDRAASLAFMRSNLFAILVTNAEEGPFATHLPVLVLEEEGRLLIRGHVAKANPHWKAFGEKESRDSLVIFHGPHAYISPRLYELRESVPTWNYATVHAYGRGRVLREDAEKKDVLGALIAEFDATYEQQWTSLGNQYHERMLGHIIAFEIEVMRLEAKFKLSQNRTKGEQANIIETLGDDPDPAVSQVAKLMRELGLGKP